VLDTTTHLTSTAVAAALAPYAAAYQDDRQPQRVYAAVRGAIRNLHLRPGQTVLEREVASALGLSRTPVREALVRLEADHLVRLIPRRGFAVLPVDAEDMRRIYEIVEGLEGMAVLLAAERRSAEDLERLEHSIRLQEAALAAEDLVAWTEADEVFHQQLLDASGNPHVHRLLDPYTDHLHRVRLYTVRRRPRPVRSTAEHRIVVEIIRTGNGRAARELHQSHWQRVREEIVGILHTMGMNGEGKK
jgi:GntR family transcriptional regulator, rspAB operon transcriptional repressor